MGNAGTVKATRTPFFIPPTIASGTATTSRNRDVWRNLSRGVSDVGPTRAPGCTSRSIITPEKGAVIVKYCSKVLERANRRFRSLHRTLVGVHDCARSLYSLFSDDEVVT